MKLYVTRHGETEYSLNNIVCGSTDCPLTDFGRGQARGLAEDIVDRKINIGLIYSSPLIRARETADIIADVFAVPVFVDYRLREQHFGAYEGNVKRDDAVLSEVRKNFAHRLSGGESTLQLAQRVYNFLDDLSADRPEGIPLIVGHICVCRMIDTYFFDLTNDEYARYRLANCGLVEYEF